ncbi:MAG: PhoH family protein [Clostridia bacterium]|nr:PhoH family protein [Clostridia bacterium]
MEKILHEKDSDAVKSLFGNFDENIKIIENKFSVNITSRNGLIKISGDDYETSLALSTVETLLEIYKNEGIIDVQKVNYVCSIIRENSGDLVVKLSSNTVCVTASGKVIKAKTIGQAEYIESMIKNTIVFGIGPAGTGKTYLAVAAAVNELRNKNVKRIILTRPAIEAGEKLGFLPGDLQTKIDPYLRPLYDALYDMLGAETCQNYIEKGIIEIAPLAYMRGRTLDDSFIILDEAQNTTSEQMKMFLTRIGFSSKAVVTGDVTQIDLPRDKMSGLKEAQRVLKNIDGIDIKYLSDKDVVRHPLVQKIIVAYEKYNKTKKEKRDEGNNRKD